MNAVIASRCLVSFISKPHSQIHKWATCTIFQAQQKYKHQFRTVCVCCLCESFEQSIGCEKKKTPSILVSIPIVWAIFSAFTPFRIWCDDNIDTHRRIHWSESKRKCATTHHQMGETHFCDQVLYAADSFMLKAHTHTLIHTFQNQIRYKTSLCRVNWNVMLQIAKHSEMMRYSHSQWNAILVVRCIRDAGKL